MHMSVLFPFAESCQWSSLKKVSHLSAWSAWIFILSFRNISWKEALDENIVDIRTERWTFSYMTSFLVCCDLTLYCYLSQSNGSLGWPPKFQHWFWNLDIESLKLYVWPQLWMTYPKQMSWGVLNRTTINKPNKVHPY